MANRIQAPGPIPSFQVRYLSSRTALLAAAGALLAAAATFAALPGDDAAAATYVVTKEADTADGACDSDCSLREAVLAANLSGGADVITLPAGDYHLDISGADEDLAAAGDLDLQGPVTINGAGSGATILDGMGNDRVFDVFDGPSTLSGMTVRGGHRSTDGGGGVRNYSVLTVTDSVITANTAPYAGGLENVGGWARLTLSNSTVSNNSTTGGDGAIINNTGVMAITGSTISGNHTDGHTGGIENSGGELSITNSTVSGNSSGSAGGGIRSNATLNLYSVTVAGNIAGAGASGGVTHVGGTVTMKNSIVANNTAGVTAADCGGTITSAGHNLVENRPAGCTITGDTTGNIEGQDPGLGPLLDNGGPTKTHSLQGNSPAVDAGTNTGCPGTDQRGFLRPVDGNGDNNAVCDTGSFEFGASPPNWQEVAWGDHRCDGQVDPLDALSALRVAAGLAPLPGAAGCPAIGEPVVVDGYGDLTWGDVTCGGGITAEDVLPVLRFSAGLPPSTSGSCPVVNESVRLVDTP